MKYVEEIWKKGKCYMLFNLFGKMEEPFYSILIKIKSKFMLMRNTKKLGLLGILTQK